MAPSADNALPWHFIVVTEPEIKEKLATGRWNRFVKYSAVTIVGCGYAANRWTTLDVGIVSENMLIAAEAQGGGSCWIGEFKEKEVKKLLRIPDYLKVVALASSGYPAEKPTPRGKKTLDCSLQQNLEQRPR